MPRDLFAEMGAMQGAPSGGPRDLFAESGIQYQPPEAPPQSNELWKGFVSGIGTNNIAALGHSLEGFGQITGTQWARDYGNKIIGMSQEFGKPYQPSVPSYENIRLPQDVSLDQLGNFFSDLSKYSGYALGSGLGSTAMPVAAGLGVAAVTKNPVAGLIGGAIGPSYVQNFGDVYGSLKDELKDQLAAGQVDPAWVAKTAALATIPVAALDVASLGMVLGKLGFGKAAADVAVKELKESIAKAAIKGAATGAITEATTEGAQEAISQGVQAWAADKPFLEHERIVSIIDNAIAGGLTGGAIGGGAGAYGRAFPAKQEPPTPDQSGQPPATGLGLPKPETPESPAPQGEAPGEKPAAALLPSSPNASSYVPSENERVTVQIPGVPDAITGTVQGVNDVDGQPWVRVQADDGTIVDEPLAGVRVSPLRQAQSSSPQEDQPPVQLQAEAPVPASEHAPSQSVPSQTQASLAGEPETAPQSRPLVSPVLPPSPPVIEPIAAPDSGAGIPQSEPSPHRQPSPMPSEEGAAPRDLLQPEAPRTSQEAPPDAPQEASESQPRAPLQSPSAPPLVANLATAGGEDQGKTSGAHVSLSEAIAAHVKTGGQPDTRWLTKAADEYFGGTSAEGKWTRKDLYDAVETGMNIALAGNSKAIPLGDADVAKARVRTIRDYINKLPTQTVRSEEQTRLQQFSTPHDYAFAAAWLANIGPNDVVLEPSAGTGNIATMARNAKPAEVIANEIAPGRAALLKRVFKQSPDLSATRVFEEDAEQLNNILPDNAKPTVVVMNPPFSRAGERMGDKMVPMTAANHIDQALKRLEPGGRLVAIVGQGMGPAAPKFQTWFKKVSQDNTIRANVGVAGKVYAKYGTNFGTRVLVIDKTPAPADNKPVVGEVEDIPALIDKLAKVRDDRSTASEQPVVEPARAPVAEPNGRGRGPVLPVRDAASEVGAGQRGANPRADEPVPVRDKRSGGPDQRAEHGPGEGNGLGGAQPGKPGVAAGATAKPVDQPVVGKQSEAGGGADLGTDRGSQAGGRPELPASGKQPGLKIEASDAAGPGAITGDIYEPYTPQRLKIAGAKDHPGELVQSAAMASVAPPAPTYTPTLPKKLIENGELSLAQLEAIVYAGQAHAQELETGERRGFFIGDGTGVGKGREIAGIILDNWQQGRKKALWISEKKTLIKDAARDWSALGGKADDLMDISKVKAGEPLGTRNGIGFMTYDTLKSAARVEQSINAEKPKPGDKPKRGKTRIDQIVEWLGKDFDGVIALDEAHNLGNAVEEKGSRGTKDASQKALAGIELQEKLPKARVVYVSATGATEVANLAYASRLGLWGRGTAFENRQKFISAITEGGVAAMELVSRDLKALGLYTARSLSFRGTEQERVTHTLTPQQREIYDKLAEGWQSALNNINKALELTGAKAAEGSGTKSNSRAISAARSAFWGAHQRFFNQIITAMQMPTVITAIEKDMKEGRQAVLQLVNTNEASQERAIAKRSEDEDFNLEDLDMTPKDQLLQMVEHSFPVQQYEEYVNDEGQRSMRAVTKKDGTPVINKEAVALREKLLDELGSVRVPAGPIEMLLDHFGVAKTAEVTGRKRRVVYLPDKKTGDLRKTIETRSASANIVEAQAFQSGEKPILIFSDAGGTGRSYHAERGTKASGKRRVHYLIQPGWRADKAIQGLGRTHRTNQESAPIYRLPEIQDLKGQRRFISSIARRLSQLGALTRGERKTGDQGLFKAADNLESTEAKDALYLFYRDLAAARIEGLSIGEFMKQTGMELIDKNGGGLRTDLPPITTFLNRLLSLKIDLQNQVFDAYSSRLDSVVAQAIAEGTLDQGVSTVEADKITKDSEEVVYTEPVSGAETKYVKFTKFVRNEPATFAEIEKGGLGNRAIKFFYKNKRSGRVYAVVEANDRTTAKGDIVPQFWLEGPMRTLFIEQGTADEHYDKLTAPQAKPVWDAEVAAVPEFTKSDVHMISGAILPVWDRIRGSNFEVSQLYTDKKERFLGRVVSEKGIGATLKALGAKAGSISLSPQEIMQKIVDDGYRATLSNDWTLKRSRVANQWRIEILGPNYSSAREVTEDGAYSERINYDTRYFIPVNDAAVLEKITKTRPIVELASPHDEKLAEPVGHGDGIVLIGKLDRFEYLTDEARKRFGDKVTVKQAREWVTEKGKLHRHEYMMMVAPDGELLTAGTSGRTSEITLTPAVVKATDAPGADIEFYHNHPGGSALSGADLVQLAKRLGIKTIHAFGHNGSAYRASLTPLFSGPQHRIALQHVIPLAENWFRAQQRQLWFDQKVKIEDGVHFDHIFNQALHDVGAIEYIHSDQRLATETDNPHILALAETLRIKLSGLSNIVEAPAEAGPGKDRGPADSGRFREGMEDVFRVGTELPEGSRGRAGNGLGREGGAGDGATFRETDFADAAGGPDRVKEYAGSFQAVLSRLYKGTPVPEGTEVVDPVSARDTTWIAKLFKTPLRLFRNTSLEPLINWGIDAEDKQSRWMKKLETAYSKAVAPIIKNEASFNKVTGALFTGDLARTALTPQALAEMGLNEAEQKAFNGVRSTLDETARLIDMHRRKMLPQVRKRKAQVLRTMDAFLGHSGVSAAKFNAAFNRLVFLRQQLNTGNRNPETVSQEIKALERELLDMVPNDPELVKGYKSLLDELKGLDERLAQTTVRRIAGYVPHKFFGSWRLFKKDGVDDAGKTKWKEITSDQGFFRDRDDALKAAGRFKKDNPDAELRVAPKQFSWPFSDEGTQLSDAAYRKLRESIMENTGLQGEELNDMMKGVARTWFRRRLATFTQHREGAAGYSKDLNRVMRAHIAQAVRYVTMDELKYKAINLIERSGLSPAKQLMQERPILQQAVLNWWRDINGQKQTSEKFFDEWFDKPWFTPARGAMLGGALGVGVGGLANPIFGAAMGGYLGYRMWKTLKTGGDFKTRALTGSMLSDMAHLKLGSFFNVSSALVNLMQTPINTYPILGAKYTAIGMRLAERALRDQFFGRKTQLSTLLTRADINSAFKIGEQQTNIFQEEGKLGKWSMWMFNSVETMNRAVAFFGARQRALDSGANEGGALAAGKKTMQRTQFAGGMANRPEILRNTFARVPLQFKNFMAQQLAFMFGMNRREFARFLVAMTLAAGGLGLPFLQIGDVLLDALFGFSPVRSIKNAAIASMAYGNMAGTFAETLARGLPAMFGIDISQRVGMGQGFFPSGMSDVTGPWFGTLKNLKEMSANGASATDYLRQLAPGIGSPLRALESAANGMPVSAAITDSKQFFDALANGQTAVRNPRLKGQKEYSPTGEELLFMAAGFRPLQEAVRGDIRENEAQITKEASEKARPYLAKIAQAYVIGGPQINARVDKIIADASAEKVTLTKDQIKNAVKNTQIDRIDVNAKKIKKSERGPVYDQIGNANRYFGALQ